MSTAARWSVASARQHLPEVINQSAQEPQQIFRRDQLAAVVVSARDFAEFEHWRKQRVQTSGLFGAFAQLRLILEEEGIQWDMPARADREVRGFGEAD